MARTIVVTPWHNPEQIELFKAAWNIPNGHPQWMPVQDTDRSGCARTKNRGINLAMDAGASTIIILDDDCFPLIPDPPPREIKNGNGDLIYKAWFQIKAFDNLISDHERALEPQPVEMFEAVTDPRSRGTPYFNRTLTMPVAASMGFWTGIGDYDAPGQLVHGATRPMEFRRKAIHGRYFPLCGMNLAFRVSEWPWCQFIDVPRFDDIWQGFLWQRKAYSEGKCFNLAGPLVEHSRQSNVWANLRDEAPNLERNETLWQTIATAPLADYESFRTSVQL